MSTRSDSAAAGLNLAAENKTGNDVGDQDKAEQNESGCPCLLVPLRIGRNRILVNCVRQRRGGLVPAGTPKEVAKSSEQKRRGLACNSGQGQHDTGCNAR